MTPEQIFTILHDIYTILKQLENDPNVKDVDREFYNTYGRNYQDFLRMHTNLFDGSDYNILPWGYRFIQAYLANHARSGI